jgi:hypothetical protein
MTDNFDDSDNNRKVILLIISRVSEIVSKSELEVRKFIEARNLIDELNLEGETNVNDEEMVNSYAEMISKYYIDSSPDCTKSSSQRNELTTPGSLSNTKTIKSSSNSLGGSSVTKNEPSSRTSPVEGFAYSEHGSNVVSFQQSADIKRPKAITAKEFTENSQLPNLNLGKEIIDDNTEAYKYPSLARITLFLLTLTFIVFLGRGFYNFLASINSKPESIESNSITSPNSIGESNLYAGEDATHNLTDEKANSRANKINENEPLSKEEIRLEYNSKVPLQFMNEIDDYDSETIMLALQEIDPRYHDSISISLVTFRQGLPPSYAGYQDHLRRYPASLVKLFWITALYGHYQSGILKRETAVSLQDEWRAVHDSDNESASRILDTITNTRSDKDSLTQEAFKDWFERRLSVNLFFEAAGFEDLNLTQKTFPIPYLDMDEPIGLDRKIREIDLDGNQTQVLTRNYLTSFQITRLLHDIAVGDAISNDFSFDIKNMMLHDHNPSSWSGIPYNAVKGFLGESLPPDAKIYTKIGYTQSFGRSEAAIIESESNNLRYIIVVLTDDPYFSSRESKVFPALSKVVYGRMVSK